MEKVPACPNCGAPFPAEDAHCANCGAARAEPAKPRSKASAVFMGAATAVLVFVGYGLTLFAALRIPILIALGSSAWQLLILALLITIFVVALRKHPPGWLIGYMIVIGLLPLGALMACFGLTFFTTGVH